MHRSYYHTLSKTMGSWLWVKSGERKLKGFSALAEMHKKIIAGVEEIWNSNVSLRKSSTSQCLLTNASPMCLCAAKEQVGKLRRILRRQAFWQLITASVQHGLIHTSLVFFKDISIFQSPMALCYLHLNITFCVAPLCKAMGIIW